MEIFHVGLGTRSSPGHCRLSMEVGKSGKKKKNQSKNHCSPQENGSGRVCCCSFSFSVTVALLLVCVRAQFAPGRDSPQGKPARFLPLSCLFPVLQLSCPWLVCLAQVALPGWSPEISRWIRAHPRAPVQSQSPVQCSEPRLICAIRRDWHH